MSPEAALKVSVHLRFQGLHGRKRAEEAHKGSSCQQPPTSMVRRVATQVHKQVARLARTGYIQQEPLWYKAVLEHPPIPLPPRSPSVRDAAIEKTTTGIPYDLPCSAATPQTTSRGKKPEKPTAKPVVYLEDDVRKQFFRDHPYEAFRERSLVEGGVVEGDYKVSGEGWTRLSQKSRNPSAQEYVSIFGFSASVL